MSSYAEHHLGEWISTARMDQVLTGAKAHAMISGALQPPDEDLGSIR